MKYFKNILLISFLFLFTSCVGFWDCYNNLVLVREDSNILLVNDSSAFFSNNDFELTLNECLTNCSPDTEHIALSYMYINSNIIANDTILLRKEYFIMSDSLDNSFTASKMVFDQDDYDYLTLLPKIKYNIFIIISSNPNNNRYFYSPLKMNFAYKLFGDDTMKYFFKDCNFKVKYFYEKAQE